MKSEIKVIVTLEVKEGKKQDLLNILIQMIQIMRRSPFS
jgi:hypothetical protein